MRVGILGSGLMGGKLGTLFARAGHEVVFSYSRTREKLKGLARNAGGNARAGTPAEAAKDADALLVAVHWSRLDDVLSQAGDLSGKVVVSCSMPLNDANRPSLLYCGDDRQAKNVAATLIRDVGFDPVDAGPLRMARYTEPFVFVVARLAYQGDGGPELAYRLKRFKK